MSLPNEPAPPDPAAPPGRLSWNAGGWFGSVFGATMWMFLTGALVVRLELVPGLAILVLGLGVVVCAVGMWKQRARLSMARAIQVLLATSLAAAALTIWLAMRVGILGGAGEPNPWPYLLIYPALMLWFRWLAAKQGDR